MAIDGNKIIHAVMEGSKIRESKGIIPLFGVYLSLFSVDYYNRLNFEFENEMGEARDLEVKDLIPGKKLVIRAGDSYEATGYMTRYGAAKSGKCYMLRGVTGAFMDLIYGGDYPDGLYAFSAEEPRCRATGDPHW